MNSTKLSTILNRMNRNTQCSVVSDAYKVVDLDEALRTLRRETQMPWMIQKSSIRIFQDVFTYPIAADHDALAYIDVQAGPNNTSINRFFPSSANYRYTNLTQFFQDPDNRNQIAEIWDGNVRYLAVNYKDFSAASILLDEMEDPTNWTASGDASNPVLDNVNFISGNGSIRFTNTVNTGAATMVGTLPSAVNDPNYQQKYVFMFVYFTGLPTSLDLQLRIDDSNYLYQNGITTQFSGQPFKINQGNLVAFDLNTASVVGTIGTNPTFTKQAIVLHGAPAGAYNLDASYLRQWSLQDYWYYSLYSVALPGASQANQEYFLDPSTQQYNADSLLVGDTEWADVIMYDAMMTEMTDQKATTELAGIQAKRDAAWQSLLERYPSISPLITTNKYQFQNDYSYPSGYAGTIISP